jgi:hypothetical protein
LRIEVWRKKSAGIALCFGCVQTLIPALDIMELDGRMTTVTHDEIVRLCPGIEDHTALEILDTKATVGELEAALQLLQDSDEGLIDIKQREGDQINRLLDIFGRSEIRPLDDRDR